MFGGLTANSRFLAHFHGVCRPDLIAGQLANAPQENNGIWAGLVSAMYQIGGVCALPFVGPAIDTYGRRVGMFIGSILIVLGTVITGTTIANASVHQVCG